MSCQQELRGDLHLTVPILLEGREISLIFVGVHLLPVPVVSCSKQEENEQRKGGSLKNSESDLN